MIRSVCLSLRPLERKGVFQGLRNVDGDTLARVIVLHHIASDILSIEADVIRATRQPQNANIAILERSDIVISLRLDGQLSVLVRILCCIGTRLLERLAIVNVQCPRCLARLARRNDELKVLLTELLCCICARDAERKDSATADVDGDVGVGDIGQLRRRACTVDERVRLEVVEVVVGEINGYVGNVFLCDRRDEDGFAKEELQVDAKRIRVGRVLVP